MLDSEWYRVDVRLSKAERDSLRAYAENKGFDDWEDSSLIEIAVSRGIEQLKREIK